MPKTAHAQKPIPQKDRRPLSFEVPLHFQAHAEAFGAAVADWIEFLYDEGVAITERRLSKQIQALSTIPTAERAIAEIDWTINAGYHAIIPNEWHQNAQMGIAPSPMESGARGEEQNRFKA